MFSSATWVHFLIVVSLSLTLCISQYVQSLSSISVRLGQLNVWLKSERLEGFRAPLTRGANSLVVLQPKAITRINNNNPLLPLAGRRVGCGLLLGNHLPIGPRLG